MKKNVANQKIAASLVSKTDGSDVTAGTTTVYLTIDGGAQTSIGTATHEGNGCWTIDTGVAGNTNGDHLAFTFVNTNAVSVTVNIYTTTPQTGDSFARLGAPAGASVSADIAAIPSAPSAAAVADAVWDEATAGHQGAGSSGKALTDAGAAGTPPTTDQIADAVWNEAKADHGAAGSFGEKVNSLSSTGVGDTEVDHNTGGADNMKYVDGNGTGIDNGTIRAFLKSDYDAGNRTDPYMKDYSKTTVTGAWQWPMHLDSGHTYTIEFYKQNEYSTSTKEITI